MMHILKFPHVSLNPYMIQSNSEGQLGNSGSQSFPFKSRELRNQAREGLWLPNEMRFKGHRIPHLFGERAIEKEVIMVFLI